MMDKISGIYCIENIVNGKKYIGCAVDIRRRLDRHFRELKYNYHDNVYLQRSYNKYGENNFKSYIVQEVPRDEDLLELMEIYWIAYYNSFIYDGGGYNSTRGGYGTLGRIWSDESRAKLSASKMGQTPDEETRQKLRDWERTPEMFARITETKRKKGVKPWNKGVPATEEAKRKISESRKGMKLSKENCQAIANGIQGLKRQKNTSSKCVGVTFSKQKNRWTASIFFEKKRIHIGTFQYEIEAAMAYNEFALDLYGYKATLNDISQEEIDNLWNLE